MVKPALTCETCLYYPKCVECKVFGMLPDEDCCDSWEQKPILEYEIETNEWGKTYIVSKLKHTK